MIPVRTGGLLALMVVALFGQTPDNKPPDPTDSGAKERPLEAYRMVPVRVHLLRAPGTGAGTKLTKEDVERIIRKANVIWQGAGIHFWIESILSEKPEGLADHEPDAALFTDDLRPLRPRATCAEGMFNLYYIKEMEPNGIYMGRDAVFVKETAQLRSVPGGIDEPLPRVTAHELGHGMGLPHRQDTTNLMASGTTGISLNEAEIDRVRNTVAMYSWVETTEDFLEKADALARDGKIEAAETRYHALLDISTASPLKERALAHLKYVEEHEKKSEKAAG